MNPIGTDTSSVILLSVVIIFTFAGLFFAFWSGWWISQRYQGTSPYTGTPLRRATDLSYYVAEKTMRYLYNLKQYDNRVFRLSRAAYCRETGRIFQDCVSILEVVRVDWTFIKKRYPGNYVSWGSLSRDQQRDLRDAHETLERFQTLQSSPDPSPRMIEPEYILVKPGPLYVDVQTKVLVGWQVIPDTEVEVLVVQKPVR